MNLFSYFSPPLVGVDVQPDGVRIAQLKKSRQAYQAQHMAMSKLPQSVFYEGRITRWDILSVVLTELVQALRLEGLGAVISLPVNLVRMQELQVPSGLSETEITAEIHAEARRDLPGMTDALCIDYIELAQTNPAYTRVFFAAAREDYLAQYVQCINASGLKVKIADVDVYALKRVIDFVLNQAPIQHEVHAILYVTNGLATLIVFKAHEIIFHQCWDLIEHVDFSSQLNSRIQMYLATYRNLEISKMAVCGAKNFFHAISKHSTCIWPFEVYYPDFFARVKMNSRVEAQSISLACSDFFLAYGLAMREAPKWS